MEIILSIGKFFFLLILSMVHSFNYINHIPFILLYLYNLKKIHFFIYVYLTISLVIYDITKYFLKSFSIKMIRLIGVHEYLSFSLGLLILVHVGFSFIFYFYKNLLLFIVYRVFLSVFNNLSSFIIFPLSQLYNNKKIKNKLESFSFFQKFFIFLIFPISLITLNDLNSFSLFCLLLSIINIFCFIFYFIIFICNTNQKEREYYPQISEKLPNKKNNNAINEIIKEHNDKREINKKNINKFKNVNSENFGDNTNLDIISGEIKNKLFTINNKNNNNIKINNNEIQEGSINDFKKINELDNKKTMKNNYNDNSFKNKLYQKNSNNSEIINKIESSSDVALGQFYVDNNKNKSKHLINHNNLSQKPISYNHSNIHNNNITNNINIKKNSSLNKKDSSSSNANSNKNKNKIDFSNISIIYLILINSIVKFILFFSTFLLLIKFLEIKHYLNINRTFYASTGFVEIIELFSIYYFINTILFLINKNITTYITKGSCFIKYFIFYLFQLFYLISLIMFIYIFFNKTVIIRKNIILLFVFELSIFETSMIMLIHYNRLAVNKGLNQNILKKIKSLGIVFGAIFFIIFNSFRGMILYIIKMHLDRYFLYSTFLFFFILLFIIGCLF